MAIPAPTFLSVLLSRGTSPALVWYGDQERIELSGKVVAMHLAKITQYLLDDLGVDSSSTLVLDLPPHWKSVMWALAGQLAECTVALEAGEVSWNDVVVTSHPTQPDSNATNLALTLESLAFSWPGELPEGYDDAASAPMRYPDSIDPYTLTGEVDGLTPSSAETPMLAVPSNDLQTLTKQFAGAISHGYGLVIISPQANTERVISGENASTWGRI